MHARSGSLETFPIRSSQDRREGEGGNQGSYQGAQGLYLEARKDIFYATFLRSQFFSGNFSRPTVKLIFYTSSLHTRERFPNKNNVSTGYRRALLSKSSTLPVNLRVWFKRKEFRNYYDHLLK